MPVAAPEEVVDSTRRCYAAASLSSCRGKTNATASKATGATAQQAETSVRVRNLSERYGNDVQTGTPYPPRDELIELSARCPQSAYGTIKRGQRSGDDRCADDCALRPPPSRPAPAD